jgi:hypothetical protein
MSNEKKIFIDEDWKSQVEREKEAISREAPAKEGDPGKTPEPGPHDLPPASFEMLVTTFASEAMVALGQLPNPFTNEHSINWDHARYTIDMLQIIEDKTKGNLTTDEAAILETLLHQLRLAFVTLQNEYGSQSSIVNSQLRAGSSRPSPRFYRARGRAGSRKKVAMPSRRYNGLAAPIAFPN